MQTDSLDQLLRSTNGASLQTLEADVWKSVAEHEQRDRGLVRATGAQLILVLIVSVGSAIGGGVMGARALSETPTLGVFSPHAAFAPSSRLLGHG